MEKVNFSVIFLLFVICFRNTSQAADAQFLVEQFLSKNEVISSQVFCRTDIPTAECRTLILFKDKLTGKGSLSFQIAFSAPSRQMSGTEFFILNDEAKMSYSRIVDSSMDGKLNVVLEEANQQIFVSQKQIFIKSIKFGPVIADLHFNSKSAVLNGIKDGQKIQIVYPKHTVLK